MANRPASHAYRTDHNIMPPVASLRDWAGQGKSDPNKMRLANELRVETTMPLKERLSLGSRGYLTRLLYRGPRAQPRRR